MKIAPIPNSQLKPFNSKVPILSLVLTEGLDELTKGNSHTYELLTDPTDTDSTKYKMNVRILYGGEEVRTILTWYAEVRTVIEGTGATTWAQGKRVAETMMKGNALSQFQHSIDVEEKAAHYLAAETAYETNAGDEDAKKAAQQAIIAAGSVGYRHFNHVHNVLRSVVEQLLPSKCLARVKRSIRRDCRKPRDMPIRTFWQNVNHINQEELPLLPPFRNTNSIGNDEMIDILLYATPKSWQREMERQGFDPLAHSPKEVVTFMEQIEASELFENNSKPPAKSPKTGKSNSPNNGKSSGQKNCLIHGHCGHSSDECKVLQAKAKEVKSGPGNNKGKWSEKAKAYKKKGEQEANSFFKKAVAEGVKKELASIEKKRSAEALAFDKDDDDLKEFNLENMSIGTEVDV